MKQEQIHDALNFLDDDLIEATDALRNMPKKRRPTWIHWTSLASSICILAGILWLLPSVAENTASDGAFGSTGTVDFSQEAPNKMENESELADSTTSVPQITVQIHSLNEDGFLGTVTNNGIWDAGTVVQVMTGENASDQTALAAGTVVMVQFTRSAKEDTLIIVYAEQIWQKQNQGG